MKRVLSPVAASLAMLLGISACVLAQQQQPPKPAAAATNSKELAATAVQIVRVINTAEVVDCRTSNGKMDPTAKFLPWPELLNAPCFKQAQSHFLGSPFSQAGQIPFSSGPEVVPGLELRLVVSPQGDHYNLWLGQKGVDCGFAYYSDERGLIFEGKVIGCDAAGVLGRS